MFEDVHNEIGLHIDQHETRSFEPVAHFDWQLRKCVEYSVQGPVSTVRRKRTHGQSNLVSQIL